jgi:hypothetical protein
MSPNVARGLASCFTVFVLFAGCELKTSLSNDPDPIPAKTLVVNEVFTLPPDHPVTHSWIEFINPTKDTIDLTGWTITLSTFRFRDSVIIATDSTGTILLFFSVPLPSSYGLYDVPFATPLPTEPGETPPRIRIPPLGLYTLVNNEGRMLDHTRWGPGDERMRGEVSVFRALDTFYIISITDTLIIYGAVTSSYPFYIQPKHQLLLKNPAGTIVDVVRMGDTLFTSQVGDSLYSHPLLDASNKTIGYVPEFESIARYAGGHFTGNTASDFYVTRPGLRPIPHWYSQLLKR